MPYLGQMSLFGAPDDATQEEARAELGRTNALSAMFIPGSHKQEGSGVACGTATAFIATSRRSTRT